MFLLFVKTLFLANFKFNLPSPTLLLTGHSGFLGRILHHLLQNHFKVHTLGRSADADIRADLSEAPPTLPRTYDWVVHNAGKAHVIPRTEAEGEAFFRVNTQGTKNLLEALGRAPVPPRMLVYISSTSVYGLEEGENISEEAPLLGQTPYARSKIEAEQAIQDWAQQQGVQAVILRPPLIVGPDAPGSLEAMHRAVEKGYYVRIGGNRARKSAVLGADIARLIPTLAGKSGMYNLTDGVHPFFHEFEAAVVAEVGKPIRFTLPLGLLQAAARLGDGLLQAGIPFPLHSDRLRKMTGTLTFSDEKARRELGWAPKPVMVTGKFNC